MQSYDVFLESAIAVIPIRKAFGKPDTTFGKNFGKTRFPTLCQVVKTLHKVVPACDHAKDTTPLHCYTVPFGIL